MTRYAFILIVKLYVMSLFDMHYIVSMSQFNIIRLHTHLQLLVSHVLAKLLSHTLEVLERDLACLGGGRNNFTQRCQPHMSADKLLVSRPAVHIPVSSSSKRRKALRISSLESFSLCTSKVAQYGRHT